MEWLHALLGAASLNFPERAIECFEQFELRNETVSARRPCLWGLAVIHDCLLVRVCALERRGAQDLERELREGWRSARGARVLRNGPKPSTPML
jgi:hypothetical protein